MIDEQGFARDFRGHVVLTGLRVLSKYGNQNFRHDGADQQIVVLGLTHFVQKFQKKLLALRAFNDAVFCGIENGL